MKKTIWLWCLFGFAFTVFSGTVLHFLYDWLGEPMWIAPFSAVNESTFEHMKLIFWPMFIFGIFESFFFRETPSFWCVKLYGILIGFSLIPVLFYTYNGVIGKSPDFINIAIFFVSAAVAYLYEWHALKSREKGCKFPNLALEAILIIAILFIVFTFNPPRLGIFRDPITSTYGIS